MSEQSGPALGDQKTNEWSVGSRPGNRLCPGSETCYRGGSPGGGDDDCQRKQRSIWRASLVGALWGSRTYSLTAGGGRRGDHAGTKDPGNSGRHFGVPGRLDDHFSGRPHSLSHLALPRQNALAHSLARWPVAYSFSPS